jgi:hypothetical protein
MSSPTGGMQALQERLKPSLLEVALAQACDAAKVAQLYQNVYGTEYPCHELFTEQGMREFLTFERSHTITYIVSLDRDIIAAGTFQVHGRVAYSRGWMVHPAWQGKMGTRKMFQIVLLQAREDLAGRVDYFYGEARTATAKIHAIIDEIGWRPLAALPRKDIFEGKRETEIIYAYFYDTPSPTKLRLTPKAARAASAVLQKRVPSVRVFVPSAREASERDYVARYSREPNGDSYLHLTTSSSANLDALFCTASRNSEKVVVHAADIADYGTLLKHYLAEVKLHGLEYAEVYAPADSPARQKVLEDLGFSPTGFVPGWYAPGADKPGDYVVYTVHFFSSLPDCPACLTPAGAYLQEFLTAPAINAWDFQPEDKIAPSRAIV